jgi:aspartyl protease family protein
VNEPENNGPWQAPREPKPSGLPTGLVLWLVLLVAISAGIWLLNELFPGPLSGDDGQIHVVRSVSLLALISSGLIFTRRVNFGQAFRNISIWVAIAAVVLLGYSYQDELTDVGLRLRSELLPSQPVTKSHGVMQLTKGDDGHFKVAGTANGTRLIFLIDTGASDIVLSLSDARLIGIDLGALNFSIPYQTANGLVFGARFHLQSLSIGSIEYRDVQVSINKAEMNGSLLGMSFLNRLSSYEVSGRKLILRQ